MEIAVATASLHYENISGGHFSVNNSQLKMTRVAFEPCLNAAETVIEQEGCYVI